MRTADEKANEEVVESVAIPPPGVVLPATPP
jgi:hypothetical protein